MLDGSRSRFSLMLGLLFTACILTYVFKNFLETGVLYTHFFYVPIIMACIWWKKRGLIVTVILGLLLMLSQHLFGKYSLTINDSLRTIMFFVISIITVALSEQLTSVKGALSASEKIYQTIFETTGTAMIIIDDNKKIMLLNRNFERLTGFERANIEDRMSIIDFVDPSDWAKVENYQSQRRKLKKKPKSYEFKLLTRKKTIRDVYVTVDLIPGTNQSVASLLDVTQFKQILESQRDLQSQLAEALEKALSGFIPICANCKKIREKNGNWVQIESFLHDRTKADFSHGICPDCVRKLYPTFQGTDAIHHGP
ncbi:PAS domain S-box protein [Desulfosarcina ovata]|uniref:PAS domain-containing protein n=2 Tax=Desulfosarcina ovata TaxID=83564 RepID=A0A5K8A877_9BACT|nr:PAS domain S-box protein [Desulfosarcina ovata]BBO81424.1 hypothetical protein DSCO28_19900 [Desulfosarcina ovata subsp. sediminis]BBO88679.1 hypothetical protein DSCOOX_18590 [Desulfosarcina ovata subsp. ovata]